MNVGDIRKAIEGLPDEAPIVLHILVSDAAPGDTIILLADIFSEGDRLVVGLHVEGDEDDMDDFDDPEDFPEDE